MNDTTQVMTFGKHKGRLVSSVIHEHLGYMVWALANVKFFKLSEDNQKLFDETEKLMRSRPKGSGRSIGHVDYDFDEWGSCADAAPY